MRSVLRIHFHRRLFLDDAFLLLACAVLTGATPIIYRAIPSIYFIQESTSEGLNHVESSPSSAMNAGAEGHLYQSLHLPHEALLWTVIFLVKFSFLSFFRQLVDRVYWLVLYWKVVSLVNVVACVFCVCFSFMECPRTDNKASRCSQPFYDLEASS